MATQKTIGWGAALSLGLWGLLSLPSAAAENVLLRYRGFGRTVPVAELAELAETGEPPRRLAALLRTAGQDPADLRRILTAEAGATPIALDRTLNSLTGEWVLDQLGTAIYPPSGQASRQALRSALVASAQDDNRVTLLEVLENYPGNQVVVNGNRLEEAYRQFQAFTQAGRGWLF